MSQLPDDAGTSQLADDARTSQLADDAATQLSNDAVSQLSEASPSGSSMSALHPELPEAAERRMVGDHRVERDDDAKHEPAENKPPARPELRILETQVLRGPNYWSYDPAIRLLVDLGSLEHWPSNTLPAFTEALIDLLPGLRDHGCSLNRPGGFIERLREGTWLGHVAEHVALELQREAGGSTTRGKTRKSGTPGVYNVIYGYNEEQVGLAAGKLAVRLINHLVEANPTFDFIGELESLVLLAERAAFGPSTQAILDEAARRDIPYIRLNEQSFVQLGMGKYQQRIRATMTSRTSALGVDIAGDKKLTTALLASAGLPVPRSETVRSVDEALGIARRIGFPVVTKPLDGNHGRGVSLDLRDEDDVRRGFERALQQTRSGTVVVESYIKGNDYRVLVIDGHMVAVAERVPAHVVGDGEHTVRQLVDITNRDPRRGIGHEKVLTRIKVDEAAEALVRRQGFALDDVPPKDQVVKLAATANMSTGGISIDRTAEADHDNVEIAEEAARVVGLDVAGIDFLTPDISQPVRETGGAIVEVNAAPGFRMHTHPTEGDPQYVAKAVIDMLFPQGTPARIPIIAITGSNGKTTTTRMIAHIMKGLGKKVGMTTTDGIYIDSRLVKQADASGPRSARMVLQNPRVDFAVFEVARGGILREGLGYSANDVAVVLNVTGDHLGIKEVNSLRQLAAIKRVIVEAVPRSGAAVLNADDELVAEMRSHCSGSVILFSMREDNPLIDRWVQRGRKAFVLQRQPGGGELMVLREGRRSTQLAWVNLIPATFDGRARANVQNALAAAAAAHAAGAHVHDIRQGLRSFHPSFDEAPGRLNLVEVHGVRVVVDYAHNPHSLAMAGDFVERLTTTSANGSPAGRRIAVIASPGDRRDEDMRELGRVAARIFDIVIVREDANKRGRQRGEIAGRVIEGVRNAGDSRVKESEIVIDERPAIDAALDKARPGDVVLLCVDKPADTWRELEARRALPIAGA